MGEGVLVGRVRVRTNDSNTVDPVVESYLRFAGIGGYRDQDDFPKRLREKHGPIAGRVLDAIAAREAGEDVDIYPLKNAALALSIDVTAHYYSRMYTEFLGWFFRTRFSGPRSVLDVGCDNGMLTCFYATLYPAARVIGIDKCAAGIACARELAARLELANVRFEVCDLQHIRDGDVFPERPFDLILSTTVFHEVLGFPEDVPDSGCGAIAMRLEDPDGVRIAAEMARLLCAWTGTLVSMERCAGAGALAWWIRVLGQAGLGVDADRSTLLGYDNVYNERETLPIVVATRGRRPAAHSLGDIRAFRNYEDPTVDK